MRWAYAYMKNITKFCPPRWYRYVKIWVLAHGLIVLSVLQTIWWLQGSYFFLTPFYISFAASWFASISLYFSWVLCFRCSATLVFSFLIFGSLYYSNAIMSAMASQIIGVSTVYWTDCSGADQRKHQSSVSLAFVTCHRWIPLTKCQWREKSPNLMTSSWSLSIFEVHVRGSLFGRFYKCNLIWPWRISICEVRARDAFLWWVPSACLKFCNLILVVHIAQCHVSLGGWRLCKWGQTCDSVVKYVMLTC